MKYHEILNISLVHTIYIQPYILKNKHHLQFTITVFKQWCIIYYRKKSVNVFVYSELCIVWSSCFLVLTEKTTVYFISKILWCCVQWGHQEVVVIQSRHASWGILMSSALKHSMRRPWGIYSLLSLTGTSHFLRQHIGDFQEWVVFITTASTTFIYKTISTVTYLPVRLYSYCMHL